MRVAKTPFTIDDGDFDVAAQRVMLQAIVTDDDIAVVFGEQRTRRRDTIRRHHHRATRGAHQEHGFVADHAGITVCGYALRPVRGLAAITAGDESGTITLRTQKTDSTK